MKFFFTAFLILLLPYFASADLRIDITQGNTEPIPMAILEFNNNSKEEKQISKDINNVVKNNLSRSGLFLMLPKKYSNKNYVLQRLK